MIVINLLHVIITLHIIGALFTLYSIIDMGFADPRLQFYSVKDLLLFGVIALVVSAIWELTLAVSVIYNKRKKHISTRKF